MSKVFFLRHGEAEPGRFMPDASRKLTPRGMDDIERQANTLLLDAGIRHIYHSPFVRARQTAEIVHRELRIPMSSMPALVPSGSVDGILTELLDKSPPFLLVSHLPIIAELAAAVSGKEVRFLPGTVVSLDWPDLGTASAKVTGIHHPG